MDDLLIIQKEIVIEILKYLSLQDLINFTQINATFRILIHIEPWDHLTLRLARLNHIRYVTNTYKFKKYDLNRTKITEFGLRPHLATLDRYRGFANAKWL